MRYGSLISLSPIGGEGWGGGAVGRRIATALTRLRAWRAATLSRTAGEGKDGTLQ